MMGLGDGFGGARRGVAMALAGKCIESHGYDCHGLVELSAERRAGALSCDGLAGCEHIRDRRHVAVAKLLFPVP